MTKAKNENYLVLYDYIMDKNVESATNFLNNPFVDFSVSAEENIDPADNQKANITKTGQKSKVSLEESEDIDQMEDELNNLMGGVKTNKNIAFEPVLHAKDTQDADVDH